MVLLANLSNSYDFSQSGITTVMQLSKHFSEALQLAHTLHQHQTRKQGQVPYISHLMGVSAIVMRYGGTEDEAIAALLHDAVEDQGGKETLAMIEAQFGKNVAHIVLGCSDSDQTPKPPWKERKDKYLAHLRMSDESILIVSASDKLYNALDCVRTHAVIGEDLWNLFNVSRDETKWYYQQIAKILIERKTKFPRLIPLFDETIRIIEQLVRLP